MTGRALSTVLDVSLCLLLVSAAVLTLLDAPVAGSDPAQDRAEEVATTLAGSTATIRFGAGEADRTVRGTLAGLLADAAVSNRSPATGRAFRSAVANATRPALGGPGWRAQVVAIWQPYEGSDESAQVHVGDAPPADVDVHAATMTVSSGLDPVRDEARGAAERDGFEGVTAVVAEAVVEGSAERPTSDVETEIATDIERSFDDPVAAADAVGVGRVHVTVRAWSP